jgi:hypothetical protein
MLNSSFKLHYLCQSSPKNVDRLIPYLEKMPLEIEVFALTAKRKNNHHNKNRLQVIHTIVPKIVDSTTTEFSHKLSYYDKMKTLQGSQTWHTKMSVLEAQKPMFHIRINQMNSDGAYSLGHLMHGFYSLFLTHCQRLQQTKIPYIFNSTLEALGFHVNLEAKLLKATGLGQAEKLFRQNNGFSHQIDRKLTQKTRLFFRKIKTREQSVINLQKTKQVIPFCGHLADNILFLSAHTRASLERRFLNAIIRP